MSAPAETVAAPAPVEEVKPTEAPVAETAPAAVEPKVEETPAPAAVEEHKEEAKVEVRLFCALTRLSCDRVVSRASHLLFVSLLRNQLQLQLNPLLKLPPSLPPPRPLPRPSL
jgi:hypothetical protein